MRAKNKKGEELYYFITVSSNDFMSPHVTLKTWVDCMSQIESMSEERDSEDWYVKVIKRKIDPPYYAEVEMLCNHKGWGGDFIKIINVQPAYIFD